tara:strand:+ start:113 stop:748 length:636 start_codon:yes stop_codon:yes gene_type:complete
MNSRLISKIIAYKNKTLLQFISFFDRNKKYIKIILPMIILVLSAWLTKIILDPINFEKERNYRYTFIKEKLIDIRSAQLAYKEKNGQFTHNFDELIMCVKRDSFIIVQKKDTLIEYYNNMYREYQFKDTMLIDTLGKVSILDSLFTKNYPIDSLGYVPPLNNVKFTLRAGVVNKSKIDVPVFEAKDPEPYDRNKPLIIGSMIEANLNGNWQ